MMIHIPLETPSKKNSRVVDRRTGRTFPSKKYTEWHRAASSYLLQQGARNAGEGPFALYLEFTHGDRVRRDSDNGVSSILDLLVDCGVLQDDNWMVVSKIVTTNLYDKGRPGVQISIVPLTDAEKLSRL